MKGVFIFGAGVSGLGAINFCIQNGIKVHAYDDKKEKLQEEIFTDYKTFDFTLVDYLILSPGIPLSHPLVLKVKKQGIPIISDLEFFKILTQKFGRKDGKIIGISGSNGKSTTSALLNHILKACNKNVFLGGNIGLSPLTKDAFEAEFCIFEVSSYQLEITNFIFDASILLNITPDHISHHGTFENYKKAKLKILENSKFNVSSADCPELANNLSSFKFSTQKFLQNGFSFLKNKLYKNGNLIATMPEFENLKGEHNKENIIACIVLALEVCGLELDKIIEAISSFKPLPHRIEFIKEIENIKFYNDSKATNPSSTLTALRVFPKTGIFLIAGGIAKETGIEELLNLPEFSNVKEVLLIGEASGEFAKKIILHNKSFPSKHVNYCIPGTLEKAVKLSFISAKKSKNNIVLFSPLCASFDQFKNFEERGDTFKKLVLCL